MNPSRFIPALDMRLVLLLTTGALLGLSTNIAKIAGDAGLKPLPFLAWSVLGAALVLSARAARIGQHRRFDRRTIEYFVLAAILSVAGPNLIFFSAIPHVGASFVALMIALPPLLTYAGSLYLGLEHFNPWRAAGVVLALIGAATIAISKLTAAGESTVWLLLTLLGPVLLAMGNIYRTSRWPAGARPEELAPGMLWAAAALLFVTGPATGRSIALDFGSGTELGLVLLQAAVFASQYLLFFRLQKAGGPVYLSLLGSVGAMVSIPISLVLLGERVPSGLPAAGALIAAGVLLLTLAKSPPPAGRPT